MRTNLRNKFGMKILLLVVAALLASASLGGGVALAAPLAAPVTVDLCATAGSATMPDGTVVDVWGYVSGDCTGSPTVTQPGGPTIDVNQGDEVTVNLYNNLGEDTALLFQGQALIPDLSGAADGAMTSYTFTAANPGTYLYEAGLLSNAQHQVAMGLYGALVVRPATAGQAYDDPATAYEDEAVLVLSEIDPALNNGTPAGFDMRNYQPRYRLINGVAYPDTVEIPVTAVGDRVLLRYVNAGLEPHSMGLLGLHQTVIANDGSPLLYSHTVVADTLAPGETQDTIATIPLTAASGSKFALYDASLLLRNSSAAGAGGMLTFLALGGALPGGDGPITSAVTVGPSPTNGTVDVTLSATITAGTGLNVTAAEYFVDATGADGAGCPFTVASANMVNVSATIPTSGATSPCVDLATLTSGSHTFYVHGQDDATTPQWGPFSSAVLNLDKAGPATSGLTLAPNPSNGSTDVALSGTASDSATGGSNIAAAEYTIDGGLAVGMNVNAASPIANITASIPAATIAALTDGPHVISVRSQDALGNWGDPATINLIVDTNGPTTSGVTATPNPTNGMIGFNSSTAAVRVTAAFADTLSKISAGEGFIDTVGADGTGFIFLPSDGAFNSLSESGYVDIPLTTINALGEGTYPIYVHGKDAAGNWGTTNSVSLVVDKTAPTISAVTLTPNTIAFGLGSVNLAVTASDAGGTGVIAGQYWIDGTATPPANATAFAGTSTAIDTSALAGGVHTVYVRVQDAAMNWSAVSSATLTVVQAIDDALTVAANTQASQQIDIAAPGLLANDEPIGAAGRTAALATVPIRVDATGNLGTITVTCPPSSADGVCADGSFRITLNADPGAQGGNARRASKRGTFEFTYTETLNGVPSTATVTITVN